MKYPQDLAIKLNNAFPGEDLKAIAGNGCLAFVLMWCLGIEPDDAEAVCMVQRMRKAQALKSDCTVMWYKAVPYLTGRELLGIDFVKVTSLKGIKERTPVLMAKPGNPSGVGHWVGVEKGQIKFNPKQYSENVEKGRPVEMRVLKIQGIKK